MPAFESKQEPLLPNRLLMQPTEQTEPPEAVISSIDTPSPPVDPSEIKQGNNLETVDFLMFKSYERMFLLQQFSRIYNIAFQDRADPVPSVISFTTRKAIIYDQAGNAYFIKQKPAYSLHGEQLYNAARMQIALSEHLPYIPPIVKTKDGLPYAFLRKATYFLTPYIQGDFYMGRFAQSIAAAQVLGEMHSTALRRIPPAPVTTDLVEETSNFIDLVSQIDFPDKDLHEAIMSRMKLVLNTIGNKSPAIQGWLHGDFAPFNLVFHHNAVIAVNDFDNVLYGPLSKDIAECVLTHCGINYAAATSSMRAPIRTTLDTERMKYMLGAYLQSSGLQREQLPDIPQQAVYTWLELIAVGLLRGDFSLRDVDRAFSFWDRLYQTTAQVVNTL